MRHFCAWNNSKDMKQFDPAYLASDMSLVTNWSQLVTFVLPKGLELLAHSPASSFVKALPLDSCVIFKADMMGTTVLNHNFFVDHLRFKERVEDSIIFKPVSYTHLTLPTKA